MKRKIFTTTFMVFCIFAVFCQQDSNITSAEFQQIVIEAESGNPNAQYALGYLYSTGSLVEANPQTAFEWWRKSAQQGNGYAQLAIGLCYANGEGVKVSLDSAKIYLKKASEQNIDGAEELLHKVESQLQAQRIVGFFPNFSKVFNGGILILLLLSIFTDPTTKDLYNTVLGKNKKLLSRDFSTNKHYVPITHEMHYKFQQFKTISLYPDRCTVCFRKSLSEKILNTSFITAITLIVIISSLQILWNSSSILYYPILFVIFIMWMISSMAEVHKYGRFLSFALISFVMIKPIVLGVMFDVPILTIIFISILTIYTLLEMLYPFVVYTELNIKNRTISKKAYGIRYSVRPMENLVEFDWGEKKIIKLIYENDNETWLMKILRKIRKGASKVTYEIRVDNDAQKTQIISFIEELFGEVGEMNI